MMTVEYRAYHDIDIVHIDTYRSTSLHDPYQSAPAYTVHTALRICAFFLQRAHGNEEVEGGGGGVDPSGRPGNGETYCRGRESSGRMPHGCSEICTTKNLRCMPRTAGRGNHGGAAGAYAVRAEMDVWVERVGRSAWPFGDPSAFNRTFKKKAKRGGGK